VLESRKQHGTRTTPPRTDPGVQRPTRIAGKAGYRIPASNIPTISSSRRCIASKENTKSPSKLDPPYRIAFSHHGLTCAITTIRMLRAWTRPSTLRQCSSGGAARPFTTSLSCRNASVAPATRLEKPPQVQSMGLTKAGSELKIR